MKRYCKTLELRDDPRLIEEYKKVHAPGAVWAEITKGIRQVGITDMEIYLSGTRLFMIMETEDEVDHEKALERLATLPRQKEWERFVSKFQKTSSEAAASEKWQLMERIFKLDD